MIKIMFYDFNQHVICSNQIKDFLVLYLTKTFNIFK